MFVLVWFRKNVKVIQPEKDTLLLKFKNLIKPKGAPSPTTDLTSKTSSLSRLEMYSLLSLKDQQSGVFCELVSQTSAVFFIHRMPYLSPSPFT